jgi:hypothetical protein
VSFAELLPFNISVAGTGISYTITAKSIYSGSWKKYGTLNRR